MKTVSVLFVDWVAQSNYTYNKANGMWMGDTEITTGELFDIFVEQAYQPLWNEWETKEKLFCDNTPMTFKRKGTLKPDNWKITVEGTTYTLDANDALVRKADGTVVIEKVKNTPL